MRADDLIVEVRTRQLQRVARISPRDLDLEATVRFNNVGEWRITLPTEHPAVAALREPGAGIVISVGDEVFISGPVTNPELRQAADDPFGTVTVTGVTDDVILADALAWPDPSNDDASSQAVAYDERSGAAETVMHGYVADNIGPQAPTSRRNPALDMGDDRGRGGTITKKARFQSLGELLAEIAAPERIGFRVRQYSDRLRFETYMAEDRSRSIRLTLNNGELVSQTVSVAAPVATRAIVGGSGLQDGRFFLEVTDPETLAAEQQWGRRIETFVDERSGDLAQAGREALAEQGTTGVGVQVEPAEDSKFRLGVDYRLGDFVTAEVNGVESAVQVTGAILRADKEGVRLGVVLGDLFAFSSERDVQRVTWLEQRVNRIERNVETGRLIGNVRAEGGTIASTTGTVGQRIYHASMPAVVFKAPPSGRVMVVPSAYLRSAAAGQGIIVGASVYTGDVIGSGSLVMDGNLFDGIANYNAQYIRGQGLFVVEGLTPAAWYNARAWYYQITGTGHAVANPSIQVILL